MPKTMAQLVEEFQRDLQQIDADFAQQVLALESSRLRQISATGSGPELIEARETARAEASRRLVQARSQASADRERATTLAAEVRRKAHGQTDLDWREAETAIERAREDKLRAEEERHQDRLAEISRILPMYEQAAPREAEMARHQKILERIDTDATVASQRAREDMQASRDAALAEELEATREANDSQAAAVESAEIGYQETTQAAETRFSEALLAASATRAIEKGFQTERSDLERQKTAAKEVRRERFRREYREPRPQPGPAARARRRAERSRARGRRARPHQRSRESG